MRDGYTNSEIGFIPDDWNLNSLEDVTLPKTGLRRGPFGGALKKEIFVENGYAVYEQQHAIYGDFGQFRYFIDDAKYYEMKAFQIQPGDILISCSGTIGRVAVVPNGCKAGVINQALLRVRTNKKKIDGRFLVFLLTNDVYQHMIVGMTHGSAMKNIVGMDTLRKIPIPLPPLPEQKKIADILTTVDDHINETESLIEKTKVLKQGLMQQLLTKGIGHTEFKDTEIDRIPVEWEVKHFQDVCICRNEKYQPSAEENRLYVALEHIGQGSGRLIGTSKSSESTSLKTEFRFNDVLFGKLRPYLKKYWLANFDGVCSTEIFVFRSNGSLLPEILFYLVQKSTFIEQATGKSYGTKMPRASWADVSKIQIPLPPLPEQRQIAAILTSVDDQIDTYQAKLTSLTRLKTGLMQQLLTGKIRVKV